ncbi:MAG: lasso peptide biosynthesis B2 protein [Pirellulales bacterium]
MSLPAAQRSDFLRSLALLLGISLGLRLFGFRRCHGWLVKPTREGPLVDVPSAAETARMVAAACAFLPLRPTCLTRSLALTRLLRRHGQPAELRIGVRKVNEQFAAHAWVECQGEAFGRGDGGPEYAPFERITPSA